MCRTGKWAEAKRKFPAPASAIPNGILASADGHWIYYNAWTAREVHKYDVRAGKDVNVVKLNFMPDNLTWTKNGHMLAARNQKRARGLPGGKRITL